MSKADKQRVFYGWVVVVCSFLATFSYGIFYSFGVFFEQLKTEFGWSATITSSIQSFHLFLGIISTLIVGRAAGKFGPRVTLACAGALVGVGIGLCSQVNDLQHFYLFYGIASLSVGALWVLPNTIVMWWFAKRRGLTIGIVTAGIAAGSAVYAPVANSLILAHGWRTAYLILGIGTWALITVSASLIVWNPEKKGLKAYGIEEMTKGPLSERQGYDSKVWRPGEWSLRETVRTKPFWLLSAVYFFSTLSVHMALVHVVPFAILAGINETAAAGALALVGGIGIAGRVIMAHSADKLGFKLALIICCGVCATMFAWLTGVQRLWMIYLFAAVYGFFYGGKVPQTSGLVGYYFPGKSLATIFATTSAIAMAGGSLGPLIGGLVYDQTQSYQTAFIIGASCWILAAVLSSFLKAPEKLAPTAVE